MEFSFAPAEPSATKTWVIVADAARVRILEVHDAAPGLRPALGAALVANKPDRSGNNRERKGHGGNAKEARTDPKDHEQQQLARQLVAVLRQARIESRVERLAIFAPPAFLGRLREAMDPALRSLIIEEDHKDISRLPEHELEARLPRELWPDAVRPDRRYRE